MIKVSVIVPVYNVEKYIDKCIQSILDQSLKEIEIIFVDDGSPDQCGKICDQYSEKDERIKVVHKRNAGVSAARNDGLALAQGEYVLFVDSDDWMQQDACENLYDAAVQNDADIVIADINRISQGEIKPIQLFENEFQYSKKEQIEQLIVSVLYPPCCKIATNKKTGYGGPWNKLIRRKLIIDSELQFNTDVGGICDDRLFNAEAYSFSKKIVYVQKPVYNYLENSSSLTKSYKPYILDYNNAMFKEFCFLLDRFSNSINYNENEFSAKQEWGEKLFNAYNSFIIWRCEDALKKYFFSPGNSKKIYSKFLEIKETLFREPYLNAAKKVNTNNFPLLTKFITIGLKKENPLMLWSSIMLYKIVKNIIK